MPNAITDVAGIKVGHATHMKALTGCTVVLCEAGATIGVDIRGGAAGTRETASLTPTGVVEQANAVLLAGGSAFGLAAVDGVLRFLEEKGVGFKVGGSLVPVVPGAVVFDLNIGDSKVRPDSNVGYRACTVAAGGVVPEGNVGAGTGATVGKLLGIEYSMKGGVGTTSLTIKGDVTVGCLVVVNSLGNIVDYETGELVAGARDPVSGKIVSAFNILKEHGYRRDVSTQNTTLAVVATDAKLTKTQACSVAQMAQDGIAMAVRPAHTPFDGDTVFVLSTGEKDGHVSAIGAAAADVIATAILRAVRAARKVVGIPSASEMQGK